MRRAGVERKLRRLVARTAQLREDLTVAEAQLAHFAEAADDAETDAIVQESPFARADHRSAGRTVEVMRRDRDRLRAEVAAAERQQDELLDRLGGA
jgi:cell division septum initiation protein DivIVA